MATVRIDDSLEKRVEELEKDQDKMLDFIMRNSDLIGNILKRERIQSIVLMLLAISQLLLALKPIIQHMFG